MRGRARVEISGGITLERVRTLTALGADCVSVGALTHSAPAADISLEIEVCLRPPAVSDPLPPDVARALTEAETRLGAFATPALFRRDWVDQRRGAGAGGRRRTRGHVGRWRTARRPAAAGAVAIWFSPPGAGLYLSVIAAADRRGVAVVVLTLAAGVAVARSHRARRRACPSS